MPKSINIGAQRDFPVKIPLGSEPPSGVISDMDYKFSMWGKLA